jgi:hypothetical protein
MDPDQRIIDRIHGWNGSISNSTNKSLLSNLPTESNDKRMGIKSKDVQVLSMLIERQLRVVVANPMNSTTSTKGINTAVDKNEADNENTVRMVDLQSKNIERDLFENESKRSKGNRSKQRDPLKDKVVAINQDNTASNKELAIDENYGNYEEWM